MMNSNNPQKHNDIWKKSIKLVLLFRNYSIKQANDTKANLAILQYADCRQVLRTALQGVNFINVLRERFSYKCLFGSYMSVEKATKKHLRT